MRFIAVVILIAALLSSCGYEGDGQYQTSGIWPLVNYSLELPEVAFNSDSSDRFSLAGYNSHDRSLLTLRIASPFPVAFHELQAVVEVKLLDELGTTYFYRKGPLNQHYLRMIAEGTSSWPLETEWHCNYQYGDPSIDNRVVPFDPDGVPSLERTIDYWHFVPTGDKDLTLVVNIENVPKELSDMSAKISLSSGWK